MCGIYRLALELQTFTVTESCRPFNLRVISAVNHSIQGPSSTVPFLLPKKLKIIESSEIKCEAGYYNRFIISDHWELDPLKLNFWVISASLYLIAI